MPIGWGVLFAELAKGGNKLLDHTLKPAVEKMKDIRFGNFKRWIKWKKLSDKDQAAVDARILAREKRAKNLKL